VEAKQYVRALISIVQYPWAANLYTTFVEFNDDPFPKAAAAWGSITSRPFAMFSDPGVTRHAGESGCH
jgi:hypothetical protein